MCSTLEILSNVFVSLLLLSSTLPLIFFPIIMDDKYQCCIVWFLNFSGSALGWESHIYISNCSLGSLVWCLIHALIQYTQDEVTISWLQSYPPWLCCCHPWGRSDLLLHPFRVPDLHGFSELLIRTFPACFPLLLLSSTPALSHFS